MFLSKEMLKKALNKCACVILEMEIITNDAANTAVIRWGWLSIIWGQIVAQLKTITAWTHLTLAPAGLSTCTVPVTSTTFYYNHLTAAACTAGFQKKTVQLMCYVHSMETIRTKDLHSIQNQTDAEPLQPPSCSASGDPGGDTRRLQRDHALSAQCLCQSGSPVWCRNLAPEQDPGRQARRTWHQSPREERESEMVPWRVTNAEWKQTHQLPASQLAAMRRVRWLSHVTRLPPDHPTRAIRDLDMVT